jgi:hypothetical protein
VPRFGMVKHGMPAPITFLSQPESIRDETAAIQRGWDTDSPEFLFTNGHPPKNLEPT